MTKENNKKPNLELLNGSLSQSSPKIYKWKKPFLLILFCVASFLGLRTVSKISNKISLQNETASTDEKLVERYTCSPYHHDKAEEISPKISLKKLDRDTLDLKLKSEALLRLKSKIKTLKNKGRFKEFNKSLEHYNAELAVFDLESKELMSLGDKFNDQANIYNKYLSENCIPAGKGKSFAKYED